MEVYELLGWHEEATTLIQKVWILQKLYFLTSLYFTTRKTTIVTGEITERERKNERNVWVTNFQF